MSGGPVLLPNFGAEEGAGKRPPAKLPPFVQTAAGLWRLLFGGEATLLGATPLPWPEALGPRQEAPAFPWIEARRRGVSWLSTREAWDELRGEGVAPAMPSPETVAKVHDKGFAHGVAKELGLIPPCLEAHIELLDPLDLSGGVATGKIVEWMARLPDWVHGSWAIKPRSGTSGRGRLGGKIPRGGGTASDRAPSPAAAIPAGSMARLAKRGGAILEPWLERKEDYSVQLHLARSGAVEVLGTTKQLLSSSGVYLGNRGLLDELGEATTGTAWEEELRRAALAVGEAAAGAGFFGPCGVDAFSFRGPSDEELLRPVVELNARFTMGTVALGFLRRAKLAGRAEGMRAFFFTLRGEGLSAPGVLRLPLGGGAALLLAPSEAALDRALSLGAPRSG